MFVVGRNHQGKFSKRINRKEGEVGRHRKPRISEAMDLQRQEVVGSFVAVGENGGGPVVGESDNGLVEAETSILGMTVEVVGEAIEVGDKELEKAVVGVKSTQNMVGEGVLYREVGMVVVESVEVVVEGVMSRYKWVGEVGSVVVVANEEVAVVSVVKAVVANYKCMALGVSIRVVVEGMVMEVGASGYMVGKLLVEVGEGVMNKLVEAVKEEVGAMSKLVEVVKEVGAMNKLVEVVGVVSKLVVEGMVEVAMEAGEEVSRLVVEEMVVGEVASKLVVGEMVVVEEGVEVVSKLVVEEEEAGVVSKLVEAVRVEVGVVSTRVEVEGVSTVVEEVEVSKLVEAASKLVVEVNKQVVVKKAHK